jgi:hypothetical protein
MPVHNDIPNAYVRPSESSDVDWLAPRLRRADLNEIAAYTGTTAKDALIHGYEHSIKCFTGVCDDKPFIMFGASPVQEDVGSVWLLGTDDLLKARIPFLRQSKHWVNVLHEDFPLLFNYVDARNSVHIRWLKWLDFKFINLHGSFGVGQLPFYEFVRIK